MHTSESDVWQFAAKILKLRTIWHREVATEVIYSNKHRHDAQSWGGGKRELKQVLQRAEARVR